LYNSAYAVHPGCPTVFRGIPSMPLNDRWSTTSLFRICELQSRELWFNYWHKNCEKNVL